MNNRLHREKRAYIAYLSELLRKQKDNPDLILEGNNYVQLEIYQVESHIADLDFVIKTHESIEV